MARLRVIGSMVPGLSLGALPVVAALVLAAGAAGILGGSGVVDVPVPGTDAPLQLRAEQTAATVLVASADRDAAVALPTPATADPPTAPSTAAPVVRATADAADAAVPMRPTSTDPAPSTSTPEVTRPAEPAATTPRPAALPAAGAIEALGRNVRQTTGDLADVTSGVTDGLAQAVGGANSLLGAVVAGLGIAVDQTVRALGDGLGALMGAQGGTTAAQPPAAQPAAP